MNKEDAEMWAFIFHVLGKENLRKMLFKAAMKKDEEGRVVVEFDGDQAMDVSEHYKELEEQLDK